MFCYEYWYDSKYFSAISNSETPLLWYEKRILSKKWNLLNICKLYQFDFFQVYGIHLLYDISSLGISYDFSYWKMFSRSLFLLELVFITYVRNIIQFL